MEETREFAVVKWAFALSGVVALLLVGSITAVVVRKTSFDFGADPPALAEVRNISITLPNGKNAVLADVIRPDRPTVISLWASWCGPCWMEASTIADLRKKFGPDRLNLISLNVRDPRPDPGGLAGYLDAIGAAPDGYAILRDGDIARLTHTDTRYIPRTLVYDKHGQSVGVVTGFRPLALKRIEGIIADQQS